MTKPMLTWEAHGCGSKRWNLRIMVYNWGILVDDTNDYWVMMDDMIWYDMIWHERCSKLQLKLNGNYSSLREILAPSLRDHNGSLHAVNFSNWTCATLREDEFLRFGAFLLARCRHEADFGLGFLGFSDSRLARLFLSFSTSWLVRWLLDF